MPLKVQAKQESWTTEHSQAVYSFPNTGERLASRTDKFRSGEFFNLINPKDWNAVVDCEYERERRIFEFLVSILNAEKPTRLIVTLANTIFGALSGEQKVR